MADSSSFDSEDSVEVGAFVDDVLSRVTSELPPSTGYYQCPPPGVDTDSLGFNILDPDRSFSQNGNNANNCETMMAEGCGQCPSCVSGETLSDHMSTPSSSDGSDTPQALGTTEAGTSHTEGLETLRQQGNESDEVVTTCKDENCGNTTQSDKCAAKEAYLRGVRDGERGLAKALQVIHALKVHSKEIRRDRNKVYEEMQAREAEQEEVIQRLERELVGQRDLVTAAANVCWENRASAGIWTSLKDELLASRQEADRAVVAALDRQIKINELRLFVVAQQRTIMDLEELVSEIRDIITIDKASSPNPASDNQELPQCFTTENLREFSNLSDVISCERARYTPSANTCPELAMLDSLQCAGPVRNLSKMTDGWVFHPLQRVPYVKTTVLDQNTAAPKSAMGLIKQITPQKTS